MRKAIFFLIFGFLIESPAQSQWLNFNEGQARFRHLVSGYDIVEGKRVLTGLQFRAGALDSLVRELKKDYESLLNKRPISDSPILVKLIQISFCYTQQMNKTDALADSALRWLRKTLNFATKTREAEVASFCHDWLWRLSLRQGKPVPEKVALLKEWIKAYDGWISLVQTTRSLSSPYHDLADLYVSSRNDEEAEKLMLSVEKNAHRKEDRLQAINWLAFFYLGQFREDDAYSYYSKLVSSAGSSGADGYNTYAKQAYEIMFELSMQKGYTDRSDSIEKKYDYDHACRECPKYPELRTGFDNEKKMMQASVFLARKDADNALPLLRSLTAYNDSTNMLPPYLFNKLWYQYYKHSAQYDKALLNLELMEKEATYGYRYNDSTQRLQGKMQFDLVRNYETQLLKDKAEKEKQLQEQRLLTLEKLSELQKVKTEAELSSLTFRAENAELQRKMDTARVQTEARRSKLEQEYKIGLLNTSIREQSKIRFLLIAGLVLFGAFAATLFYQVKQKQKTNRLLADQKSEIETRRDQLEKTLKELQDTQSQLIQREKMASLGELTAGIAHEIQNPLNFVNNFSDVNRELIDDLNDEIDRGNTQEAKMIAESLRENEGKINHHGKRADAIVKGMLQHSRNSTGVKEPTDLNALCDEYLRLSYHGLRAKDKNFNSDLNIDLDSSVGKVNIIPQDFGRVMLNLFNNAFYSVAEKNRKQVLGYSPLVSLKTIREKDRIEIRVYDNGSGIPEKLKDKIFQPFFTTKPTGQGTGLGLSLSYDVIKAHGGEIMLSDASEGAEFIIKIPL